MEEFSLKEDDVFFAGTDRYVIKEGKPTLANPKLIGSQLVQLKDVGPRDVVYLQIKKSQGVLSPSSKGVYVTPAGSEDYSFYLPDDQFVEVNPGRGIEVTPYQASNMKDILGKQVLIKGVVERNDSDLIDRIGIRQIHDNGTLELKTIGELIFAYYQSRLIVLDK